MIEVKATRSFEAAIGRFTRGRVYLVHPGNPVVPALIAGGYLVPTQEVSDDRMDSGGPGPGAFADLDSGVEGSAQAPQGGAGIDDGEGEV